MPINKALIRSLLFLTASTISVFCVAQEKKKSRVRPVIPYNHATLNAPPNMVYIRGGSTTIKYNQSSTDTNSIKKVSLTSFFIDKTEITNAQYREFTEWVIDSIAIVKYLKDDKYFVGYKGSDKEEENANSEAGPSTEMATLVSDSTKTTDTTKSGDVTKSTDLPKPIDASPVPPVATADTSKSFDTSKKRIDWARVSHRKIFESKNQDTKSKLAPLLDENGDIRKDVYQFAYTYLKTLNTTTNSKAKTKKYVTETLNIYPDEKVWAEDLTNSQTDLLVENYFKIAPYDDYPVVGVTWRQARAFCYWRSITAANYSNMPEFMKYYHLSYSLPSEAQWVYAASGYYDMISSNPADSASEGNEVADTNVKIITDSSLTPHDSAYTAALTQSALAKNPDFKITQASDSGMKKPEGPAIIDSTPIHRDNNGLLANFKQDEGDYWQDGSALTLPVMSFAPNEFGLYNMEGNVSEWVLDAYSPSTFSFVSDLNPALLYDADSNDVDAMRRKVVRGGSFMSNAKALSPYYRDLELDNVAHCYIGFRCVLMAPEVLYRPVETRKKRMVGPNSNKISQRRSKNN